MRGVILAGGLARRLQQAVPGADKGLMLWQGLPLVTQVARRLAPQVDGLIVVANRNQPLYAQALAQWQPTVVADAIAGFQGPLAGMHAGLLASFGTADRPGAALAATLPPPAGVAGDPADFIVYVPSDAPSLPADLAQRLLTAALNTGAMAAYACDASREHPSFGVLHRNALPWLEQALRNEQRALRPFLRGIGAVATQFDDDPKAFANLNDPQDFGL